jgi:hypothetical protein
LDGVAMDIINESQPEFRQRIGNYLEQCAPNPQTISLEQLTNILPISLRELAWIIAICEGKYPYITIPWEFSSLKDRVEVLHNIFLTTVTQEIADRASTDGMESFNTRIDAIHKIMGIQWEIAHDYNGKGIPTYWVLSINDTDKLKSIIVRLLSAIRAKMVTPTFEPIQMMPWIKQHNKEVRSNQIIRLLNKICVEQPLRIDPVKISEPVHSYNLAWIIVICNKGLQWIEEVKLQELELTPLAEITNGKIMDSLQKSGHPHKLKVKCFDEVDLRGSGAVKKIFSYEIPPTLVLELISNNAIYKNKENVDSDTSHRPASPFPNSSITIIINIQNNIYNVDARILNNEVSYTETSNPIKENNRTNHCDDIDTTIDTVLRADFTTLIRKTFPEYSGKIQDKTSSPHKLVIKIMIMMVKLGRQDITWSTVKGFIEEHIYGNYERERLAKIEEFNDDVLVVDGTDLTKGNASRKVGEYKNIFKIKEKFK